MDNHTGKPLLYYEFLNLGQHPSFYTWLSNERLLEETIKNLRGKFKHFQACFQYEKVKKELLENLLINFQELQDLQLKDDKKQESDANSSKYKNKIEKKTKVIRGFQKSLEELNSKETERREDKELSTVSLSIPTTIDEVKSQILECTKNLWDEKIIMTNLSEKLSKKLTLLHKLKIEIDSTIKSYYRRTAYNYHPDRNTSLQATKQFQLLARAYAVIKDETKRKEYNEIANHILYLHTHNDELPDMVQSDDHHHRKMYQQSSQYLITMGTPNKVGIPRIFHSTTRSVKIDWTHQSHPPETHFIAEMKGFKESRFTSVHVGIKQYCIVEDLFDGDYYVRLRAVNSFGEGPHSEEVYFVVEDGQVIDPFSKEERKRLQDSLKEEAQEAKRKQRKNKKAKKQRETKPVLPENKLLNKIITAIQKDKLRDIEKIIEKEGTEWLNCVNKKGDSPLIVAVELGNEDIAKYLLKIKGIDLEVTNSEGRTALMCAVENEVLGLVNQIILYGADVNAVDYEGNSALHLAVERELEDVVILLIKKGADVNIRNMSGQYPINIAASIGSLDIVQILVENDADIDIDYEEEEEVETEAEATTPVIDALLNGHDEIVVYLVEEAIEQGLDHIRDCILHTCVLLENKPLLMFLIEKGADVNMTNASGDTPLHLAYFVNNSDIISYLINDLHCDTTICNLEGKTAEENKDFSEPSEPIIQVIVSQETEIIDYIDLTQFYDLPEEIILKVFYWVYFTDLCHLRQVCKKFNKLADDPTLWKNLFEYTFQVPPLVKSATFIPWKEFFVTELSGKKRCSVCGRTEQLKLCAACKAIFYCSHNHQKQHWPQHKKVCFLSNTDTMKAMKLFNSVHISDDQ